MQKKFFYITVFTMLFGMVLLVLITYVIDPQQQFRYNENYVSGEQRNINFGLARNYDYNTVILGTSTSENILKAEVDNIFKVNSVNLSIMGSTAYEQRNLLEIITNRKDVKMVIYGLDYFAYNFNFNEERIEIIDYGKKMNILKYVFNISSLEMDLKILVKKLLGKNEKNWIYNWSYWGDDFDYGEEKTLDFSNKTKNGRQNIGQLKVAQSKYNKENLYENLYELEQLIIKNKDIKYKIYLPPYSTLYWYILKKYNSYSDIIEFRNYLIKKLLRYSNVEIYDFQTDDIIVSNLNNYKDSIHYSPKINSLIIKRIKENKNKVEKLIDKESIIENLIEKSYLLVSVFFILRVLTAYIIVKFIIVKSSILSFLLGASVEKNN